ncbi:MAG: tetraacyldisaccharide 4'-kinase [Blastocatellia bacterium]|nr:MAG: tetraacyldisaccharide 4'-kinase [Blastocatellia bacterium]
MNRRSILLPPLSALYGALTKTRLSLYRRGTFRTSKLPAPVISVGNLTVGGTGKTPLVEWVAKILADEGKKVCILTRGYKRKNPGEHVLVSDGEKILVTPLEAGDEAFLLANRLVSRAAVVSDANRIAAGEGAMKHLGSNCFVLDDGFQHLRLARDLDIVAIDATYPWGGGNLLPYGRLREPRSGLSRAHCVVVSRVDQIENYQPLMSELRQLTSAPIFTSRMKTIGLEPIHSYTTSVDSSKRCFAFCGVGNPDSFFRQLSSLDLEVVERKAYADHQTYSQHEVSNLVNNARRAGADWLVTTEKDSVKLRELSMGLPCYFLRIEIEIDNEVELKGLLKKAANCLFSSRSG